MHDLTGQICRQHLGDRALLRGTPPEKKGATWLELEAKKAAIRQANEHEDHRAHDHSARRTSTGLTSTSTTKASKKADTVPVVIDERKAKMLVLENKMKEMRRQEARSQDLKRLRKKMQEDLRLKGIVDAQESAKLEAEKHSKRANRIKRVAKMAKDNMRNGGEVEARAIATMKMDPEDPDVKALQKRRSCEERAAALAKENDVDKLAYDQFAEDALRRYDPKGNGFLELTTILAVLEDVGLRPQDAQEKAALRRTFLNLIEEGEEVDSVSSSSGGDSNDELERQLMHRGRDASFMTKRQKSEFRCKFNKLEVMTVEGKDLGNLLHRVRSRLVNTRSAYYFESFEKYDPHDTGDIDHESMKLAMEEEGIYPSSEQDLMWFHTWLKRKLAQAVIAEVQKSDWEEAVGRSASKEARKAAKIRSGADIDLTRHRYQFTDFELIASFLLEERGRRQAQMQMTLANRHGLNTGSDLFIEFRRELDVLVETFHHFDADGSGSLEKGECFVALNVLGMWPLDFNDKAEFLRVVKVAHMEHYFCEMQDQKRLEDAAAKASEAKKRRSRKSYKHQALATPRIQAAVSTPTANPSPREADRPSSEEFTRRRISTMDRTPPRLESGLSTVSMTDSVVSKETAVSRKPAQQEATFAQKATPKQANPKQANTYNVRRISLAMKIFNSSVNPDTLIDGSINHPDGEDQAFALNFTGFLKILSRCRQWATQHMAETLLPVFERNAKKQNFYDEKVVDVSEISKAIESLGMSPHNYAEQKKFQTMLNDVNVWGFEPQTFPMETFVSIVRQTSEWVSANSRKAEHKFAMEELNISETVCNEYRLAYDALDDTGSGLDITRVRKCFKMFGRNISSDHLRESFAMLDEDSSGSLDFLEFLSLVHDLDKSELDAKGQVIQEQQLREFVEQQEENSLQMDADWQMELVEQDLAASGSLATEILEHTAQSSDGDRCTPSPPRSLSKTNTATLSAYGSIGQNWASAANWAAADTSAKLHEDPSGESDGQSDDDSYQLDDLTRNAEQERGTIESDEDGTEKSYVSSENEELMSWADRARRATWKRYSVR